MEDAALLHAPDAERVICVSCETRGHGLGGVRARRAGDPVTTREVVEALMVEHAEGRGGEDRGRAQAESRSAPAPSGQRTRAGGSRSISWST
jgi:hypothetical protein